MEMSRKTYNTRLKIRIENKSIVQSVNEVLFDYCKIEPYLIFSSFRNENLIKADNDEAIMKSENLVLNEINADLWDKALFTTLGDISYNFYPHFKTVQKIINYILNYDYVDIGTVMNLFSKLLLFHPPKNIIMQNYYWHILNDKYVVLSNAKEEEKNIFWFLIEALTFCLVNKEFLTGNEENYFPGKLENCKDEILRLIKNLNKKKSNMDYLELCEKTQMCFDGLSPVQKFERSIIILEFLYEILEADFLNRTRNDVFAETERNKCLFSALLWDNVNETGVINAAVRKLIHTFKLMEEIKLNHVQQVHKKLMTLLAEVIRWSDFEINHVYPFFGVNSNLLAYNLALEFIEPLVENFNKENMNTVKNLKPHWLRLLVCSRLLSYVTGKACPPELNSVHDLLKHLNNMTVPRQRENRNKRARKKKKIESSKILSPGSEYCYIGCKLIVKKSKRPRISQGFINDVNENGWGPLHLAILLGHHDCVKELLNYRSGKNREIINTRLKGVNGFTPLMCAVMKNQRNVCRLLLEHSGSELIEDVTDDGQTLLDLCQDKETAVIIKYFGGDRIFKQNENDFYFTREETLLVLDLCVQLVESYFLTYRTWDVHKRSKKNLSYTENVDVETNEIKWDYARYQSDLHTNIGKLIQVLKQMKRKNDIGDILHPLYLILHCNTLYNLKKD